MIASDVSESVRRNAVIALGFLFIDRPAAFLPTAQLLLQSYNPHIRYAAALIAGIINAGTANAQLSDSLLKTMDDAEDFVAQGAAIGRGALLLCCFGSQREKFTFHRQRVYRRARGRRAAFQSRYR